MARTDRSRFQAVLVEMEAEMDRLFKELAETIGRDVLAAAGPDGTVPEVKAQELMAKAAGHVAGVFVGASGPYDDRNKPMSPYAELMTRGQMAMIDLALLRQAKIVDQHLPEELQSMLADRYRFRQGLGG